MKPWIGHLAILLCSNVWADDPKTAKSPPAPTSFDLPALDAYIAGQVKEKEFIGLSVGVLREGKPVFAKGYGRASIPDGNAVDTNTRFAIGSVTKQFICGCILLLAEEGKLSVNDKVAKWYPDLTRAQDITLYDLMSHTSGYPDYYPLDFVDRRLAKPIEPDKLIHEYATGKLDFEPGSRWSYSNTGYIILGRIAEKVAGESLDKFLKRRIFEPLHMGHTIFEPKEREAGFARGYTSFAMSPPEPAISEAAGWCHAAGGIFSTPGDILKWDNALMNGTVLKPDSFRLMTSPRVLSTGKVRDYGCGLLLSRRDSQRLLAHGGAVSGFLTRNVMLPDLKSAVVLVTNSDVVDEEPILRAIISLLLSKEGGPEVSVPKIQGKPAKEAAQDMLRQLAAGDVDRSKLAAEYNLYLTDEKIRGAKERLQPLGEPTKIEVERTAERGGMEVARVRFTFKNAVLSASMYRTPDGIIQQFFINKD